MWKYKIVYAGIIMTAMWFAVLYFLPERSLPIALPIVFITDFAAAGFFFSASMIFYEKNEQVVDAIIVTPTKVRTYLLSKTLSVSTFVLSVATALLFLVQMVKGFEINFLYLVTAFISIAPFFVLLGILVAMRYDAFLDMIIPMGILFFILFLPFLTYINSNAVAFMKPLSYFFPTFYMMKMTQGILTPVSSFILPVGLLFSGLVNWGLFKLCVKKFNETVIGRGGHHA